MSSAIQVSSDGHVHIGGNSWVSLEAIQQAVLAKQNPALNTDCPEGKSQIAIHNDYFNSELHLPLPSTERRKDQEHKSQGTLMQTINTRDGNSGEHLELPSTARRTE